MFCSETLLCVEDILGVSLFKKSSFGDYPIVHLDFSIHSKPFIYMNNMCALMVPDCEWSGLTNGISWKCKTQMITRATLIQGTNPDII